MKVIIAGSRTITDINHIWSAMSCLFTDNFTEIVSGMAIGVDTLGEQWAEENGIAIKHFPADWKNNGKAAGAIRNIQMANYADILVAIWDGKSRGTKHMIDEMLKRKKIVFVYPV